MKDSSYILIAMGIFSGKWFRFLKRKLVLVNGHRHEIHIHACIVFAGNKGDAIFY